MSEAAGPTDNTTKAAEEPEQSWQLTKADLTFLPTPGDFSIVCRRSATGISTLRVNQEDLKRCSGLFQDMFTCTSADSVEGKSITCDEESGAVAIVLCAALDPENPMLKKCDDWSSLSPCLSLAIKWIMPQARHFILANMMALVADSDREIWRRDGGLDVVPYFAEAALRGTAFLSLAKQIWRSRPADLIQPIVIPPHVCLELSPFVCSNFVQAIVDLIEEQVFSKS